MPRKKELPYQTEGDIFATRLREIMKDRGENQTTLAARITEQSCVIQRQSISQYMQGQSKPDTVRLTAICKALNVSADFLLGLAEHETPDFDLRKACEYIGLSEEAVRILRQYLAFEVNDLPNRIISAKGFGEYIEALIKLQRLNDQIKNDVDRVRACIQTGTEEEIQECRLGSNEIEESIDIALYRLRKAHGKLVDEIIPIETITKENVQRCIDDLIDAQWGEGED